MYCGDMFWTTHWSYSELKMPKTIACLFVVAAAIAGTLANAEEPQTLFSSDASLDVVSRASAADQATLFVIVGRFIGKSETVVNLADNTYATLCSVTVTPDNGGVLVSGQAVLWNADYSSTGGPKNNIVVRSAIRILDDSGHHVGVADGGTGSAVDVLDLVTGQWLTVQPTLFDQPATGVPVTYEVAAVTSYHPYYASGTLEANYAANPCYISVTLFKK